MTIPRTKSSLRYVLISDSQLVVACAEINLREDGLPLKLIKQVINHRKRIPVLDRQLVQLSVVNAHAQ